MATMTTGERVTEEQITKLYWKLDLIKMAIRSLEADAEGKGALVSALAAVTGRLEGDMSAVDCKWMAEQVKVVAFAVYVLASDFSAEIEYALEEVEDELKRLAAA